MLMETYLKFGKLDEEILIEGFLTQFCQCSLVEQSCLVLASMLLFELSSFDVTTNFWSQVYVPLQNFPTVIELSHPLFELEIGIPSIFIRFPSHPILKDAPHLIEVAQHLFHVSILIPELIHSRQVLAGSFPHVASMVDELVAHLHLSILQPETHMLEVDVDGSFENGTRTIEFSDAAFPFCVLDPGA